MATECRDHEYLKLTVAEPLAQAVLEVCQKRPVDPIEYIAGYLHQYQQRQGAVLTKKHQVGTGNVG